MQPILALLAFGFFPLFAQALLFRDFLSAFEGHEFAIGCFYGSWLIGLAVGGGCARATRRRAGGVSFRALLLLYAPLYLLQDFALLHLRGWAGVERYATFPLGPVVLWSLLANTPVSALTGWLFPRACREPTAGDLPLARVYVWESLGAFLGGSGATILLAAGVAPARCLALGFAVLAAPFAAGPGRLVPRVAVLLAAAAAVLGSTAWQAALDRSAWDRVIPGATRQGHFSTPQGRYLFGAYGAQLNVVAGEKLVESFPEEEHAAAVVALHRAQHPSARRILQLGPGLPIACGWGEPIDWIHPDPQFARRLLAVSGTPLPNPPRLPAGEPRAVLAAQPGHYDLILINLPAADTLSLNRFLTREALAAARAALASNGVLSVCVRGAENYLGPELALLGASVYRNLTNLFPRVVLKPGDETWFMASDRADLTSDREVLRRRYLALPAARQPVPAEALAALLPPDRIAGQLKSYKRALRETDPVLVENTDAHPRALLHTLLLAARETGTSGRWAWFVRGFTRQGLWIAGVGLALAAVLRFLHARSGYGRGPAPLLLLGTTGAAGMAASVLLLCRFQSQFGSLAVHSGLLSALFMLGLALGGRWRARPAILLPLQAVFLALLAWAPPPGHALLFAVPMAIAGLLTGAYVPAIASGLRPGREDEGAPAFIAVDNLAGAAAGLLAGLLCVPALGFTASAALLIPLLGLNLAGWNRAAPGVRDPLRAAGFVVLGASAFLLAASHLLHAADATRGTVRCEDAARALAAERGWSLGRKEADDAWPVIDDAQAPAGRVVDTAKLGAEAAGYGGRLSLALLIGTNGTLQGARVLESHETPSYLARVEPWLRELAGSGKPRADLERVDGVAGATLTSDALLSLLRASLDRLAGAPREPVQRAVDKRVKVLGGLLVLALAVHFRPGRWRRRALLLGALAGAGFWLNAQYSLDHVFALLGGALPPSGLTVPFVLVVGVPAGVLLFGNLYCGYLCPFGALQELIGEWSARFSPDKGAWRWARAAKFALLALAVGWFSIDLLRARAEVDPLVTVFSAGAWARPSALVLLAVAGSLVFRRFWCRNLCPAGAFLSLLGGLRPLRRWWPVVQPAKCDLGVRTPRDLDCLQCGRCRMKAAAPAPAGAGPWPRVFALAVALGVWLLVAEGRRIGARLAPDLRAPAAGAEADITRGQPANEPALRALIEQGKLSGREALFYREYREEPE